jgi:hypothetical protein
MAVVLAPGSTAPAQEGERPSVNLYGNSGLIDMPGAIVQPDGQMTFSYAAFANTTRRNFSFQILPRIAGTVRYSTINDWNPPGSLEEDLFDRSFDLRLQILNERPGWQPSVALGFRDLLGTGVYSAEYLVASKTVARDFTVTAGVGWGRLAGVNTVENPFCAVSDTMCTRAAETGEGGNIAWDDFFRGEDMGFFGGVEWRTPIDKLTLKAEVSSDAYDREQVNSSFDRKSPVNFGAEYRIRPGITLGAYYMYGDTLGVNLVVSGNPKKPPVPQNLGQGPLPVNPRPADANRSTAWADDPAARQTVIEAIGKALDEEELTLEEIKLTGTTVDVFIVNRRINQMPKAIGRAARVLAVGMPYSVETFRITPVEDGLPTTTVTINRTEFESQVDRPDAGQASWDSVGLAGGIPVLSGGSTWRRDVYPLVNWAIIPVPSVQLFGGNEGFRPQLSAEFRGSVQVNRSLSFSSRIRQPILGVFELGPEDRDTVGDLPTVRSESGFYYEGWDPKLMRLTGDYLFKLNRETYGRVSLGMIERAFGGASTEVLWKPVDQDWGLGAELNWVAQRDSYSWFGFGEYDYDVVMGHASLYWDTGWYGLEVQLDAGRYLAGDWGGTLSVQRIFSNGWAIGAYVTRTDVSAEEFGEGSYDKGILLTVPLRWATPFETRQAIQGDLRSLGSNAGAQLNVANRLYPTIRNMSERRLEESWGTFWE